MTKFTYLVKKTDMALGIAVLMATICSIGCGQGKTMTSSEDQVPTKGKSQQGDSSSSLRLPTELDKTTTTLSHTFEEFLSSRNLINAPFNSYKLALKPLIGTTVNWTLNSFGDEVSTVGYHTPSGRQVPKLGATEVGRARFMSASLGKDADLGDVMDKGHPVVTCLALFSSTEGSSFARSDAQIIATPPNGLSTIKGRIWGVTNEGSTPTIWLHNCSAEPIQKDNKHTAPLISSSPDQVPSENKTNSHAKQPDIEEELTTEIKVFLIKKTQIPKCTNPMQCGDPECSSPPPTQTLNLIEIFPVVENELWFVAYETHCRSTCFRGGDIHLALIKADSNGSFEIAEQTKIPKLSGISTPQEVQIQASDFDNDGETEVFAFSKFDDFDSNCSGVADTTEYLTIFNLDGKGMSTGWHSQLSSLGHEIGRNEYSDFQPEDENGDGYKDLIFVKHVEVDWECKVDPTFCDYGGPEGAYSVFSVHLYEPDNDKWSANGYKGYVHGGRKIKRIPCAPPNPKKPYMIVAGSFKSSTIDYIMERKAQAIRDAGWPKACLYRGIDYPNLNDEMIAIGVSSHATKDDAQASSQTLKDAGFKSFVKSVF